MLKLGNDKVKKIFVGNTPVKAVYYQNEKIYPHVAEVQTGNEYTDWEYKLPWRTRTRTPWEMEIYTDGTTSEKNYGTPIEEKEEGDLINEDYVYSYLNQNRRWTKEYEFPDGEIKEDLGVVEEGEIEFHFRIDDSLDTFPAYGGNYTIIDSTTATLIWNGWSQKTVNVSNVQAAYITGNTQQFSIKGRVISAASRGTVVGDKVYASIYLKGDIVMSPDETITFTNTDDHIFVSQEANEKQIEYDIAFNPADIDTDFRSKSINVQINPRISYIFTSNAYQNIPIDNFNIEITSSVSWVNVTGYNLTSFTVWVYSNDVPRGRYCSLTVKYTNIYNTEEYVSENFPIMQDEYIP